MKRMLLIVSVLALVGVAVWYFDVLHQPVEIVNSLIGQNYDYAHKLYFRTDHDESYQINIYQDLTEFHSGIANKAGSLTDSIVEVYTWKSINHKTTIWVGKTTSGNELIIDAIRYKNGVRF